MEARDALAELWPLFALEVRTPRLSLRVPDDGDLAVLARLGDDVHGDGEMPFLVPWTLAPPDERHHAFLQYHWGRRAAWRPESWGIDLAVVVDGEVVGCQAVGSDRFAVERTVATGSWLHRPRQGQGLGREMRAAVLHLAFASLGARRAVTSAWEDNVRSQRVSEGLGYQRTGPTEHSTPTRACLGYELRRETWEARRRDDILVTGLDRCRAHFGV